MCMDCDKGYSKKRNAMTKTKGKKDKNTRNPINVEIMLISRTEHCDSGGVFSYGKVYSRPFSLSFLLPLKYPFYNFSPTVNKSLKEANLPKEDKASFSTI